MNPQQLTQMYQEASTLAEAGRYEPALTKIAEYLRYRPQDGQALNDAATILFCMGRGQEAVSFYEKAAAHCEGDQQTQVYWNLCEAYLQENQPARAIAYFDRMESRGLLSADILNRTADALLRQDMLGPAIELILRSLRTNGDQEVLVPMLEVIRSHRPRTTLVIGRRSPLADSLAEGLGQRLELTVLEEDAAVSPQMPSQTDIALFFGCGQALVHASLLNDAVHRVVILDVRDILDPKIKMINWAAIRAVILCGGQTAADLFAEQVASRPTTLRILHAEPIADPGRIAFTPRKKGKRIAAVGPWDARSNPMFILMCFQKLHFLDPDTRLHLAGAFSDSSTERYVRHTVEAMGLDNVVFIDGPVSDLKKWFKDKHYILSASIDGGGLEAVWLAMACGLRPVIHDFPGAQRLDGQYRFTLAEDFCERVLHGDFNAEAHRAAAERSFAQQGLEPMVHDQIFRFEREIPLRNRPPIQPVVQPPAPRSLAPDANRQTPSPRPVRQIASEAMAAVQKMRSASSEPASLMDYSPSQTPAEPAAIPQSDAFKYNFTEGLSIEDLTQEGRGNVPFAARR